VTEIRYKREENGDRRDTREGERKDKPRPNTDKTQNPTTDNHETHKTKALLCLSSFVAHDALIGLKK
jgi:hypothetical protein